MLFKSTVDGSAIIPTGFCPGVDCGPYTCNHPDADEKATTNLARTENEASAKNPSPETS